LSLSFNNEVEICDGNVAEEKAEGKVINNIGQWAEKGSLEATGRDGLLDFSKCKWRLRVWHSLEAAFLSFMQSIDSHCRPQLPWISWFSRYHILIIWFHSMYVYYNGNYVPASRKHRLRRKGKNKCCRTMKMAEVCGKKLTMTVNFCL
jgi:hypothetical protein